MFLSLILRHEPERAAAVMNRRIHESMKLGLNKLAGLANRSTH